MHTSASARPHAPTKAVLIMVTVGVAGVVVALVAALVPSVSGYLSTLTGGIAGLAGLYAAVRTSGRMRLAWLMLASVMLMWAAGDVIWMVYANATGTPPLVSVADALYLLGLVPAALGLVVYPILRGVSGRLRPVLLDSLVLVLATTSLSNSLALDEVFAASTSFREGLMLAVYPLTDGLLLALTVVVLLRSVGPPRADVVLIAVSFATYLVADNGYAVMTVRGIDSIGTWVDLLYIEAPLLLAGAALIAALTPTPRRQVKLNLTGLVAPLLPDTTALFALVLTLVLLWDDSAGRLLPLALVVAVGLRQASQTTSGQQLRIRLEDRIDERSRELAELAEHYERLETLKYDFVTSVSHELRTPLTAIRGSLELLHDGDVGTLTPAAQNVVDVATRGSERLSRLVNDIIDLERLESGAFGLSPQPTDLRHLVEEAVASLSPLARDNGVRLAVSGADVWSLCDPDRAVQVVVNLVGNALKYAPAGTDVVIGLSRTGATAEVSVTDSGRGIPADELEAVFGRFHQVVPDSDTRQGGTGLGLAICQGIVAAHGGRIWVESDGGTGSTFRFTLPAADLPTDLEAAGAGLADR